MQISVYFLCIAKRRMHLFINVPRPEKNIFWPITNLPDNRRLSALSRFVATCNPPGLVSPDYYVNALIIIKFSQRLLSRQITYYNKHAKCICLCTSAAHQTRPDRHPVTIGYSARERRIMEICCNNHLHSLSSLPLSYSYRLLL